MVRALDCGSGAGMREHEVMLPHRALLSMACGIVWNRPAKNGKQSTPGGCRSGQGVPPFRGSRGRWRSPLDAVGPRWLEAQMRETGPVVDGREATASGERWAARTRVGVAHRRVFWHGNNFTRLAL